MGTPFELTKTDFDFLMGGNEKGFLICISPWPYKYIPRFNWRVKYFDLKIALVTAVACYLAIFVKDYLDTEVLFSSGYLTILFAFADLLLLAITFFSGLIIGDHWIKRKFTCTYKKGEVPMKIGQYIAVPCNPLFSIIRVSFVFPLKGLKQLMPKVKWKPSNGETKIQNIENYIRLVVSKELEKKGYTYDADIDLWIRPLHCPEGRR